MHIVQKYIHCRASEMSMTILNTKTKTIKLYKKICYLK